MAVLVAAASVALGEAPATGRDGTAPEPSPVAAQARAGKLTVLSVSDVDSIDPGITYSVFGETVANATQRTVLGPPGGAPGVVPDLASAPPEVSPDA